MIKIKNKDYELKFGFKAMLKFEEETGQSITKMGDDFKMIDVVNIVYAMLHKDVTKDEIIDAIDADMSLINKIVEILGRDMQAMSIIEEEAKK